MTDKIPSQHPSFSIQHSQAYANWLNTLKAKIRSAQIKAALAAIKELILFYWALGKDISQKLSENDRGAKVIDQLSKDITIEFSGMQGFSRRNLYAREGKAFTNFQQNLPSLIGLENVND